MTGEDRTTPRPWGTADPADGPGESMIWGADGWTVANTFMWDNEEYIRAKRDKGLEPYDSLIVRRPPASWRADAALIVEAVNNNDRLLAIEEAARNCSGSPEHFGGCGCTCHAALDRSTP